MLLINKSDYYKSAIIADTRRIHLKAVVDLTDPDIEYGVIHAASEDDYSKSSQLKNKIIKTNRKYATCEAGRWKCDGSYKILPDNTEGLTDEVGYMSSELSGNSGQFETVQYVSMQFNNVSVLQTFSIYFSSNVDDGIPSDFSVEVKQNGVTYFSEAVTDNHDIIKKFSGFTVYNPDEIKVTVTKMSMPNRRLRILEIIPGIYEEWDENAICVLDIKQQINYANTSLPCGTCTLKIDNQSRIFEPRNKSGLFESLEDRQSIAVSIGIETDSPDKDVDYTQVGVYYLYSDGWKTGDNGLTITWNMVDIIGLLADRVYKQPTVLPTTLDGWIGNLVAQLGSNFEGRYTVDSGYSSVSIYADSEDLKGLKCGDILRYVCMASGTFARASSETGYLTVEPLWNQGNYITLDNMASYPTIKSNSDIALIEFTLADNDKSICTVSGNKSASNSTLTVKNPYIHTSAEALSAAKNILAAYGGNKIEITGRGDMSSECGDVVSLQMDSSNALSARLLSQSFSFSDGVMKNLNSTLIRGDGAYLFNRCEILTTAQVWTAPSGVTEIFVSLIGGGNGGKNGEKGSWDADGRDGEDGTGGKVWYAMLHINSGQSFNIGIGSGGAANAGVGTATTFGDYTSANGNTISNGYTDVRSGTVYARTGVALPAANSGDGGKGGKGGAKGIEHEVKKWSETWERYYYDTVTDSLPQLGEDGTAGGSGCVVIWYENKV